MEKDLTLDFINRINKEREYKKYLTFHIQNVEEAYHRLIEPLSHQYDTETDNAILLCGEYITLHDLSKLSKDEFDSYRIHFYPTDKEKEQGLVDEEQFNKACEHHYKVNPHHPIHWVTETGDKLDMPLNFIFEMFCDWSSVSKWYDSSIITWYDKKANKEKASFNDKTRELVDHWFDIIFRQKKLKY